MDSDKHRLTTQEQVPVEKTISDLIVGKPKDIRDPRLFHSLSLVAFLAWVGLGMGCGGDFVADRYRVWRLAAADSALGSPS